VGTLGEPQRNPRSRSRRRWFLLVALIVLLLSLGLPPLLSWQRTEHQNSASLSNLRRLAIGFLLYTQDWDGRPPPIAQRPTPSTWLTWVDTLRPYVSTPSAFSNPANPVAPFGPKVRHPAQGYEVQTSYALNRRLWDTFSRGPFPFDNLELPGQTALFVEAGPLWRTPTRPGLSAPLAVLDYGDTTDRVRGYVPYPSTHSGKMAIVAADAHAVTVKVEHYRPEDGPHDPLYGRIGGSLYNWNGGHPNGQTDSPAHD
jgi:hypothetical protein